MLDGQGCLVPVLRCQRQQLLLEDDKAIGLVVPWLLPKLCGTDMMSHLPQLSSAGSTLTTTKVVEATDSTRKRPRRSKQGKIGHGSRSSSFSDKVYGIDEAASASPQFDEDAARRENSDNSFGDGTLKVEVALNQNDSVGPKVRPQRKRPRRTRQQSGRFASNSEFCSTARVFCFGKEENSLLPASDEENISTNLVENRDSTIIHSSNGVDKTMADASDMEFMAVQFSRKESMSLQDPDSNKSMAIQSEEASIAFQSLDIEPVAMELNSADANPCTASPENSIVSSFNNMILASSSGQPDDAAESLEDENSFIPGLNYDLSCRCLAAVPLADRGNLAMAAKRFNRLVRSSALFDVRRRCGIVERWVCIYASGDGRWMAFDPNLNKWRNLPAADVNPFFNLNDRESLSAGTHLLWLGREVFDFACYKYDLITNSWERGPVMVNPRCLFASASCGDIAFVAGGFSVGGQGNSRPSILSSAEKYDSRLGRWEALPPMHTPRQKCSGVFMDGKFFVIGGKDENHDVLTSAEAYDPVSKTWKMIPDMYLPQERAASYEPSPPLLAVANNQLYAIDSSTNLLKGYNKSNNTWKVLGPIPVRADFCNGWGLAFKALGDELFVIGGYQASPSPGVAVFSLRPPLDSATPEWTADAPPPDWKIVNFRVGASGSFLYNCAVMSC